jgi:putative nucleotidyltransferase with HDIG domain
MDNVAVEEILSIYRERGGGHYGEDVTQRQHAVQVGRHAEADGQPDEVVAAAFLHDIGHLLSSESDQMGYGTNEHERRGADWLRQRGFPERTARLVEGHVAGKRYLTATELDYYEGLSKSSKATLEYQGGPMTSAEVKVFEADDLKELHIKLRRWDEAGKDESIDLENIEFFRAVLERCLPGH